MKICPKCGKTYDDAHVVCPDDKTQLSQITSPDPLLGKELTGRYRLIQKIGEGGMGAIYRAIHTKMDRTCAIKMLTAVSSDSGSALARFNREAKMASRIDNPHAVTIYDFGEAEGGVLYLAMEFIDGKPLSRVLTQEWPLGTDRVVHITNQIAEALSAAHALGIVHRDLKPDNIMITRKGGEPDYVKVLDFGIAKTVADDSVDNLTKTGFILGTPVYMSPEQLSGEKLDARSDVYSLAIIVYEMLSRRLPFEGDNPQAIMIKRIMSDPIPLRSVAPGVSESVERAVMAGLIRDREARTPSAEAFALELSSAARSGTQMLSGRGTSNLPVIGTAQESAGRDTVQYSSSRTSADSKPAVPDLSGATIPLESSSLNQSTAPTLRIDQQPASVTGETGNTTGAQKEPQPTGATQQHTAPQIRQTGSQAKNTEPQLKQEEPNPVPTLMDKSLVTTKSGGTAVRGWYAAGGAAVLAAVAVILYLVTGSGASGFTLVVRDAPPGSEVFVNNTSKGTVAADGTIKVADLSPGDLAVRIARAGFADFTTTLTGKAGEEQSVAAKLFPNEIEFNGRMVFVPAGEFTMGDDNNEANEKPPHKVNLPAFYIDKFEVTNAQYKKFCDETKRPYPKPRFDEKYFLNNPDAPVIGISWEDAAEYARWAGKRLPREDEWEKAASWDPKAQQKRMWPWGNTPGGGAGNINREVPHFVTVGEFAGDVSAYGVHDMAGNAAEWVDSFYTPYEGNQTRDSYFGNYNYRVVRGGTSISDMGQSRTTFRQYHPWKGEKETWLVGFRCAISADEPKLTDRLRAQTSSK